MKRSSLYALIALVVLVIGLGWWASTQLKAPDIHKAFAGTTIPVPGYQGASVVMKNDNNASNGSVYTGTFVDAASQAVRAFVSVPGDFPAASMGSVGGTAKGVYEIVPFYTNFGGTGTFLNLGLFVYDASAHTYTFKDSVMLDDRVALDSLEAVTADNSINAYFKTRKEGEAMVTQPSVPTIAHIARTGDKIVLVSVLTNAAVGDAEISSPTPGAEVGSKVTVIGSAKGWYFEGSFPVTVLNAQGESLGTWQAVATSDWKSANAVGFTSQVGLPTSYHGKATIVLKKDNPSGDIAKDASFAMPIVVR